MNQAWEPTRAEFSLALHLDKGIAFYGQESADIEWDYEVGILELETIFDVKRPEPAAGLHRHGAPSNPFITVTWESLPYDVTLAFYLERCQQTGEMPVAIPQQNAPGHSRARQTQPG